MTVYLDASALVAFLVADRFTDRLYKYLSETPPKLCISDFARAECCSAVARLVRMGGLTAEAARTVFMALDGLFPRAAERVETLSADIKAAEGLVRRLDLTLRAPDAIHIAIAQRIGAMLLTFDDKMAVAAQALGVSVAPA